MVNLLHNMDINGFPCFTNITLDGLSPLLQIAACVSETEKEFISDMFGIDGKILLIHPGVGPERPDPLYDRLHEVISELKEKGYEFKQLYD